ncbi:hypothetical protein SARC_07608 [Sphaeroforma arctica JP610]|uniref:DNA-directed DNA polymerase n=1 Tax=Sphaeroforma arctica JP610 TaxID=667725 RepID=A0A0L0FTJ3_9EUKA|nr:hypothetical protein, variant [Sphaeroforma arctica JP610]XP_014153916.1 hypothetical protein SARC_07608 [Sphaeroforma arctica JP610]KNC80013.1 hypothetical protein, variant [Sphaeroforma arctica JP610]KNC80014.1 hypothetical protein SARC_07608 [Sphaeroforma arctica JP610]|eukprot:XP_014153915.1 hypothetical protein, variant [Sphaeroforma arctica JP610]
MATCHNLCRLVYSDMKKLGLKGRTVTLKLKFTDFKVITRASSLTDPTQSLTVISAETIRLLTKEQTRGGMLKLRLLGVRITHLAEVNDSESHTSENIPVQKNITSYFGNRQSLRRQQVSGGNTLKNTLADVGMDGVRNNGMVSEDSGTTYDNASSGHAVGTRENADRNRTASPGIVSGNTGITSIGQEIGVNPLNSADMKCCERPDIVWMNYSEGGPCGNGLVRESGVEVGCGDSRVVDAKNSHTSSGVEVLIQDKLTNEPGVGYSEGRVGDVINSRDTTERMQDCETRGGTDNELVGTNKLARARAPANISKPCDSWALDERGGLFGDGVERLKEEVSNSADNKKTFEKLRHRYGIEEYMCDSTRVNIERTSGPSRTVKAVPVIAPSGSSNDKNKNTGTTTERHAIRDESSFETDVQRIAVNSTPIDHRPRDMEDIREHLGKCTEIGGSCHDSEGVRIGTKDDSATAIASYGEDHTQQGQGELCDPTHTISAGNMTSATAEATNTIVKGTIADSSLGESVCESVCLDSDVSNKEMRTNSRDDSPTLDGKGLSVSAKKRKGTQLERWLASTARDACTRTSLKGTPLVASTKLPGSVLRGVGAGRHTVSVGAKKRKPTSLFEATSKSKKYKNTGKLRAVHDGAGTLARQRSSSSWKHAQASTPDGLGMPKHRPASVERETVPCPICGADLSAQDNSSVNQHIDLCLNRDQIYLHPP